MVAESLRKDREIDLGRLSDPVDKAFMEIQEGAGLLHLLAFQHSFASKRDKVNTARHKAFAGALATCETEVAAALAKLQAKVRKTGRGPNPLPFLSKR